MVPSSVMVSGDLVLGQRQLVVALSPIKVMALVDFSMSSHPFVITDSASEISVRVPVSNGVAGISTAFTDFIPIQKSRKI